MPPAQVSYEITSDRAKIAASDSWDELKARIAFTPEHATVRGMFLSEVNRAVPVMRQRHGRYIPFKNYPMREYQELLLEAAQEKFRRDSPANALLQLGLDVYPLFAGSVIGTAIFSVANYDFQRVAELSPKAYATSLEPGRVEVTHSAPGEVHCKLRDVWPFPDIFHAGIWLGAMRVCKVHGAVKVTRLSLCDVDLVARFTA